MKELKALGKKIATARKACAMTQEDLAGAAEMDRSYISEVENGHKNISVLALIKIAKALRCDVGSFFS
jgi:transcriptional regulator with XRE-family HTH domain